MSLKGPLRDAEGAAMAPEPRILAAFVQGTLDTVRRFEREAGVDVVGRLAPGTLREIEAALPVRWLPLRHDVELTEALFAAAGPEAARRVFRDAMAESMDRGFLGPLVRGALRLLGRSPERLLRWTSKVWVTLYRDAGELVVAETTGEGALRLELLRAPASMREKPDYLHGMAAAVEGGMRALGLDVRCRLVARAGDPSFEVRWKPEPV